MVLLGCTGDLPLSGWSEMLPREGTDRLKPEGEAGIDWPVYWKLLLPGSVKATGLRSNSNAASICYHSVLIAALRGRHPRPFTGVEAEAPADQQSAAKPRFTARPAGPQTLHAHQHPQLLPTRRGRGSRGIRVLPPPSQLLPASLAVQTLRALETL